MKTRFIWYVCILSEICSRIVLESCFSGSLPRHTGFCYSSPSRLRTRDASILPLLCHLTSNQVLSLTFTHSTEAFIQSDIQLSWTDEGLVQGPDSGSWAMPGTWVGSRNVLINVNTMHYNVITDDSEISVLYIPFRMLLLRKTAFSRFSEICCHKKHFSSLNHHTIAMV